MSPSPEDIHQEVTGEIYAYLREQIKLKHLGKVFLAPFDVVLAPQEVYQPDVIVILNQHLERVKTQCVMGAPDLVVEVNLPSSKLYDRVNKHMIYEKAGIPEYWLANPRKQTVEIFALEGGEYYSLGTFAGEQTLPSRIVPEMATPVSSFFEEYLWLLRNTIIAGPLWEVSVIPDFRDQEKVRECSAATFTDLFFHAEETHR